MSTLLLNTCMREEMLNLHTPTLTLLHVYSNLFNNDSIELFNTFPYAWLHIWCYNGELYTCAIKQLAWIQNVILSTEPLKQSSLNRLQLFVLQYLSSEMKRFKNMAKYYILLVVY